MSIINKNIVALFMMLSLFLSACVTPIRYSAESIEATVVDVETRQPIEGAVVVARWPIYGGLHPNSVRTFELLETTTDKSGSFYFPAWGPTMYLGEGTVMDPEITIFRSGYGHRIVGESYHTDFQRMDESIRRSRWKGKSIEIKKFTGTSEEWINNMKRSVPSFKGRKDRQQSLLLKAILAEEVSIPDSIARKRLFFDWVRDLRDE